MGSLWLTFALILLTLYQIVKTSLWENVDILFEQQEAQVEALFEDPSSFDNLPSLRQKLKEIGDKVGVEIDLTLLNPIEDKASIADIDSYNEEEEAWTQCAAEFEYWLQEFDIEEAYFNPDTGDFVLDDDSDWEAYESDDPADFRMTQLALNDGNYVTLSYNIAYLEDVDRALYQALIIGLLLSFLVLLVGTLILTRRTVSRLSVINQTCDTIVKGQLEKRIPLSEYRDDYDHMSKNINGMLDQIASLMEGVQQVSDNIAHDMRTPLTRLHNRLEQFSVDSTQAQVVLFKEEVTQDTGRIINLFNALLNIGKLEKSAVDIPMTHFNLAHLLGDIAEMYEPLAHDKGMTLKLKLDDVDVKANADLIFQAFSNLFDNAIKYGGENSDITLSCAQGLIVMQDSGKGVAPQYHEKIFRRMYRLEEHRGSLGHGLGLTQVQAIFKFHHWDIKLGDANPGLKIIIQPH
jgi:signal transduction histidine kinase